MMNKLFTSLLVGVLFFITNLAAQPTFTITPQNVSAQPNDVINFDVVVSDFENIASMQFSVNWDAAVINYGSLSNINSTDFSGLNANSFGTPGSGNVTDGNLALTWFDDTFTGVSVPDGTRIFSFSATAAADGTTAVSFGSMPTAIEIVNSNFDVIGMNPENSTVVVGDGGGNNNNTDFNLIISDETTNVGQQVCVDVTVEGFTDVLGMQYSINYDPADLEFVSVGNFNLSDLNANLFGTPPGTSPGNITLSWLDQSLSGVTLTDGTAIFEICFNALQGGTTDVSFSGSPTGIEISDTDGNIIPFNSESGTVTINGGGGGPSDFNLILSDETVNQGDEVCMDVSVEGFTDVLGMQFSIDYDPSQLQFSSLGNFNLTDLNANLFGTPPGTSEGDITLSWLDQSLTGVTLSDGTVIFQVCFTAIGEGTTDVSFTGSPTGIEVSDTDGNIIPFNSQSGTVTIEGDGGGGGNDCTGTDFVLTIGDADVEVGAEVCVPVSVCNFNDILGMQFSINYNPADLEFVSVGGFNLTDLNANLFGTPPQTGPGNITLSWLDQSLTGVTLPDGTEIFEICFTGLSEGATDVSFSGSPTGIEISDTDGNIVPFNSNSGTITVGDGGGGNPDPPFECPNNNDFYLSIADGQVEVGAEVCVEVSTCNFTDILGMQFSINYDPNDLEFVSIGAFNLTDLNANLFGTPPQTSPGNITLSWLDQSLTGVTLPSETVIFEICFEGLAEGATNVSFSGSPTSIEISDTDGNIVPFNGDSGTITVGQDVVEPGSDLILDISDATGDNGDQVCVDVSASNFANLTEVQFSLNYDPIVLEFASVGAFNLTGLGANDFDTSTDGVITLDWSNGSGVTVSNNTDIFEICFNILGDPGDESDIDFVNHPLAINVMNANNEEVVLDGRSGNVSVNFDPTALTLEIDDIDVDQGENFCLDITSLNFADVVGMQFTITYDPDELSFQSVGAFGLPGLDVNDFGLPGGGGQADGVVTVQWLDESLNGVDLSDGSTVFEICFQALGDCGTITPVQFANAPTVIEISDVNSNVLPLQAINSTVSICAITPIVISSPADITHVACNGESNGSIDITVSGGSGCYNYMWSYQGQTSEDLSNLPAGSYSVTINDCTAGLTATATYMVNEPAPLFLNPVPQNPSCNGINDGSIDLNISGGTPDYTINWSGNLTDGLEVQTGLGAGFYSATVNDINGCITQTGNIQLSDPPGIDITLTTQPMDNGNPGSIVSNVQGGNGNLTYNWTGPAGFPGSNMPNLTNLTIEGEYCLTVTDISGCSMQECATLGQALAITGQSIERPCPGESTGSIDITVGGGCLATDYQYNWSGPNGFTASTQDIANLTPGTYNVVVTDCFGETVAGSFEVNNYDEIIVTANIVPVGGNPLNSNGQIIIEDPADQYIVFWETLQEFGDHITGLTVGEYCATISNSGGCTIDTCFYVFFPLSYTDLNVNSTSCNGDVDGSIEFEIFGGLAPYTVMYNSESANTGEQVIIQGLAAGDYDIRVLDALGNEIQVTPNPVTVMEPDPIVIDMGSIDYTHDTDESGCTGSISLNITGGTGDYDVVWNTTPTGPDISGLCAGCYTPTVTDENGCTTTLQDCIDINVFSVSGDASSATCPDDTDGTIDLTISGGDEPYEIEWSHGPSTEDVSNLAPGNYTVSVTEQSGNTLVREFIVGVGSNLMASVQTLTNYNGYEVSCSDATDGRAQITPQGGAGGYAYEWTLNGQLISVDQILENAGPGEYIATLIDQNGCTVDNPVVLLSAPPIEVSGNAVDVSCFGDSNGQITVTASGGVGNFTYSWSNGSSSTQLNQLSSGNYTVIARDANNCDVEASFSISEPAPLLVNVLTEPNTDKDNCNGMATAVVTGGTPPYTYKWFGDANLNTPMLTNICHGEYPLEVVDSKGCVTSPGLVLAEVENRTFPCLEARPVITPDGDGLNEEFIIGCVEEFKDNHLEIYNRWGQKVYEVDAYQNDWIGRTMDGDELPEGPYYFVLEYTDNDNQRQQLKGSLTLLREE
jgi:gliding motility-associated-like protein